MNKVTSQVIKSGLIEKNMQIVLGISGGPDSLCLMNVLRELSPIYKLGIYPVHINHQFRENADKEQVHIEKICAEMGFPCKSFVVNCRKLAKKFGISDEEAGRFARYKIFSDMADKISSNGFSKRKTVIAVAQNADDQSETILFRIARGTGIKGLSGIPKERVDEKGYKIIRPLLNVKRTDIEKYIKDYDLEPNIDESNFQTDYSRNKLRLELIPYIEKNLNSNIKENLRRLADTCRVENDYMNEQTDILYNLSSVEEKSGEITVNIDELTISHRALVRRLFAKILYGMKLSDSASYKLIEEIEKIAFSNNPSASLDLPAGCRAVREYNKLIFVPVNALKNKEKERPEVKISIMNISELENRKKGVFAFFDMDSFEKKYQLGTKEIEVRTRKAGDIIAIGGGYHKKFQNWLVDSKVRKEKRDSIYVVAAGSEILWILPSYEFAKDNERKKGRFSQNYQLTDNSKRVLFLEMVKNMW